MMIIMMPIGKADIILTDWMLLIELSENTRKETEQISAILEELTHNADQTVEAQQSTEITERNYSDSVDAQKLLHGVLEVSHQMDKYIGN